MKKRLIRYLSLFSVVICVVITATVSSINYSRYAKTEKYDVKNNCEIISHLLNNGDESSLNNIKTAKIRITLIAQDGTVKFDTDASVDKLNNHKDREEITKAFNDGYGESQRYSSSINKNLYYYAIRLDNGDVIRVSKAYSTLGEVVLNFIPFLLVIVIVFVSLSIIIVSIMTKRIVKPINNASKRLDTLLTEKSFKPDELVTYEEFIPFIRKINNLNSNIKTYAKELKAQNQRLNAIMDSMQEGLIVLDNSKNVLSINQGAKYVLDVEDDELYIGKNFINLCRDKKINHAISTAIKEKTNTYIDIDTGTCYYKYFVSPVVSESGNCKGLIVLIINSTAEMKNAQLRRNFASNVSHELKTPLTSIAGFAEMLKSNMISTQEDVVKTSAVIHKEASRLIALVEDIIRLSQIESGVNTEVEAVSLKNAVAESILATESLAKEKEVTIKTDCDDIVVKANASSLYQMIFNLCDNAIKYNKQNGEVDICVKSNNSNVLITVSDTGIGIAHEHIDRIFERFYRVDKSRSKQTGGTGLGLSIVKHIVEDLDGNIKITSKENIGTEIEISLPL